MERAEIKQRMSIANLRVDPVSRYRVLRQLGQTQLTRIYLVALREAGPSLGLLALELLRPDLARDSDLRALFLDQAAQTLQLDHPNLVRTRELIADTDAYGRITEWVDGQPLSRVLERVGRADFPLRLQVRILCQVLAGLEYAHRLGERNGARGGFVHRDISPDSVLVTYDGQIRLIGAGFARALEALEQRLGHLLTDLGYAAPELCLGYPATPSGDIFAVGVMLWEALARMRRTFASSVADCLRLRTSGEEPGIEELYPDVPERLAQICRRALAVSPRDRYPDAAEMRVDLESFLSDTQSDAERAAGLGPLADVMDHHFAAERSEMLLFIGSQWSEDPNEPAMTRSDPDEEEDTDREEPSLFLATRWDEDTHTVTGFEEFEDGESLHTPTEQDGALLAASLESATREATAVAAEVPRSEELLSERSRPPPPPASGAPPPMSAEPEPPASAASLPRLVLAAALRSAGPPPLGHTVGVNGTSEPARGLTPSAPPPASRQMALTEPIDPAVIASVVKSRRPPRDADTSGSRAYASTASLLARGPSPFSRAILGIAVLVVLLAFLVHGGHLTRQRLALAKAPRNAPSGNAPSGNVPPSSATQGRAPATQLSPQRMQTVTVTANDLAPQSGSLATPKEASPAGSIGQFAATTSTAEAPSPGAAPRHDIGDRAPVLAAQNASGIPLEAIEVNSLPTAPEPGAARHVAASANDAVGSETVASDHAGDEAGSDPVYLRTEDFEHLREVVDAPGGGAARSSWASRSARGTHSRAKDDAPPSPASAHANTPPARLIDETDPYPE